jgi:quercetin dioxygenase-like cupin family protein
MRIRLAILVLLLWVIVARAAETPIPPSPDRWVTDTANFLAAETARSLDARLAAYDVLEFRSRPGEKSALHSHPDSVVYSLNAATMLLIGPHGARETIELRPGEVIWQQETTHALENIGATEAHLLVIELNAPVEPVPLV